MEMKDLGYTYDTAESMPTKSNKNEKHYPTIRLEKSLPEGLMSKDVGDEIEVKVLCRIASKSINESGGKKMQCVTLDCLKMGIDKTTKSKKGVVNQNAQSYME